MEYVTTSHRFALEIIGSQRPYKALWAEITNSIEAITDKSLIKCFEDSEGRTKSLSRCINNLLAEKLVGRGWSPESPIFQEDEFDDKRWRLDFAKDTFSIEVGFNHGEAIAWNLLKPVMASELNHVRKAVETRIGIVICATAALKERGGFDSAVGEYEKIQRYLRPLNNILTVPVVLVGLQAPQTFRISHVRGRNNRMVGRVVMER